MFATQADETYLGWFPASTCARYFETPTACHNADGVLLPLFLHITRQSRGKEATSTRSRGSVSAVSCARDKPATSTACMHSHICMSSVFANTVVQRRNAIISDANPQRRCLDAAELSWCNVSPLRWRALSFPPRRGLLLPFVPSNLHLTLCTRDM